MAPRYKADMLPLHIRVRLGDINDSPGNPTVLQERELESIPACAASTEIFAKL